VLVEAHMHVLFAKTRDNSIGGIFLMKSAISSFSSRECEDCLSKLRLSLFPADNNQGL
jgi:hypothetical protein